MMGAARLKIDINDSTEDVAGLNSATKFQIFGVNGLLIKQYFKFWL